MAPGTRQPGSEHGSASRDIREVVSPSGSVSLRGKTNSTALSSCGEDFLHVKSLTSSWLIIGATQMLNKNKILAKEYLIVSKNFLILISYSHNNFLTITRLSGSSTKKVQIRLPWPV
jgi:hypothetical protein